MQASTIVRNISFVEAASEARWYALKVWVRSETLASKALRNRGYEPFLPVYSEPRRYTDRVKVVDQPAFPGYIFCRFRLRSKISILSCPAVEYIVGLRHVPAAIPDEEIDAIRRFLDAGGRPVEYLQLGRRVKIQHGALAGIEGVLTRVNGQQRVTLSVELLRRSLALQIDADQVLPV